MEFEKKEQEIVENVLEEWFSANTLRNFLRRWDRMTPAETFTETIALKILCYNVQEWGSRNLEVTDVIYEMETVIGVFTEVGELWNTSRIPHFNILHQ